MYPTHDQLDEIVSKFADVTLEFNKLYNLVDMLETDRWKDGRQTGDVRVWDLYLTVTEVRVKLEKTLEQLKELRYREEDMIISPA